MYLMRLAERSLKRISNILEDSTLYIYNILSVYLSALGGNKMFQESARNATLPALPASASPPISVRVVMDPPFFTKTRYDTDIGKKKNKTSIRLTSKIIDLTSA